MLNKIRAIAERFISILAELLARIGFKAEYLSLMGLIVAILAALTYTVQGELGLYIASILVILSGFFDMLDGAVARATGTANRLGSFLDSTIDRFSDSTIIGGLILSGRIPIEPGFIALVGSLLTSYVRAKAESLGLEISGVGLIERGERILIIALSGLLNIIAIGIWALAFLSLVTVVQRVLYTYRRLR
ncbi:CDP-alcohol phosphatidyltransferase family protein [Candidatus Bathyarchaeota archaeon]|nr:CDP-alcohol phosphatidyltransferase family protein [Candidatus Bathyarchaeota archaeon]MBS7618707.1 CDP-alcohol phosphatidyltransferase family protein [Candidatus Bathyarchaeota archaeon]